MPNNLVEARGLHRRFRVGGATLEALSDIYLDVAEGELLAVVGPSGSGKTTLLGVIGGLDRPDAGSVRVAGADVTAMSSDALTEYRLRTVGFVFQSSGLVPLMTAAENVALALQLQGENAETADRAARVALLAVGLEERAEHRAYELSGGEQQRVALARAIAKKPRLLVADEPTGQLDSETSVSIMHLIRSLRDAGTTVLVATHDEALAALADRALRLEDGVLLGERGARVTTRRAPRLTP